jgi:transcriptional regulator with XRE-family HTH domain
MPSLEEFIKYNREKMGLSLREFAERCGLSHSYIDALEKGANPKTKKPMRPNVETLEKLANGLGISREALMVATGYLPIPKLNSGTPDKSLVEEPKQQYAPPLEDPFEGLNEESRRKAQDYINLLKIAQNNPGSAEDGSSGLTKKESSGN